MKKSKLRTIIKEELRRLNEDAKTEVGDGKLPNKYFVTQSTDFLISWRGDGTYDWASEKLKTGKIPSKEKEFSTFKEAKKYAESLIDYNDEPLKNHANSVAIEDRISGTIYDIVKRAYNAATNDSILRNWTFRRDDIDETSFTRSEMKKKGIKFE